MRSFRILTIMLSAAVLATGTARAADAEGAKVDRAWLEQKAQTCAGCHGAKGVAQVADYPTIAGQYKSYLIYTLEAYRDGERRNPIMSGQAQGLTDAQIEALAEYYSRQPSPLHVPSLQP